MSVYWLIVKDYTNVFGFFNFKGNGTFFLGWIYSGLDLFAEKCNEDKP